jgi:arsenite methyltransferase
VPVRDDTPSVVNPDELRIQIQQKYREVASAPSAEYHFFTGRRAAEHVGYSGDLIDDLPDAIVAPFAGVANPFHWGLPNAGERVVDVGSGAGLDAALAARAVGPDGSVIGVDMTDDMLERARSAAATLQLDNLEFRQGLAEELPVPDGWANVVISNGVLNLVPDKIGAYREIFRVLEPGGRFQIADIYVEKEIPEGVQRDINLWTG